MYGKCTLSGAQFKCSQRALCSGYGRLKVVQVCDLYTTRVNVRTSSSTRQKCFLFSCHVRLFLQSSLQPTERDMQTQKRKRRPRDVQPIPRRSKRIRNKIAAAAAAISATDAVVISDNAKDNNQSNPDQAATAIGTPRSPMVRNTTASCNGRKRGKHQEQKTKSVAAL